MARMILGREIIARVLETKNIRPYIDAGLTMQFMNDTMHPAYASVFQGQDVDAWKTLLWYYEKYTKVPDLTYFRKSYPPETYRLVDSHFDDRELSDMIRDAVSIFETEVGTTEAQRYNEAGQPLKAAEIMLEVARKVLYRQAQAAISVSWDRKDYDLEARLAIRRRPGPGFGIEELDKQFPGFQDGQLITFVGRAKSNKTTLLLQSAYHAWHGSKGLGRDDIEPRRVLFVSTEVPEEDIRDMLTCYGSGVNPAPFIASTDAYHLSDEDMGKVRDFWAREQDLAVEAFKVVQPVARFTISDLEYEIEKHEPDIVYIDGFYFLTDSATNASPISNHVAHDNLARDLANLALRLRVPVIVTHQAREKQLGKAGGGFDDVAMAGGTGLRMASFMTFTFDKGEDGVLTIKNTAARRGYVKTVKGEWDWDVFEFQAYEARDDEEDDY